MQINLAAAAPLLASYGTRRRAPAGDPIPQFRYNPATDRVEQIGTVNAPVGGGVTPTLYNGMTSIPASPAAVVTRPAGMLWPLWGILSTASMAASAYHGVKRNDSVGWGLWWGLMGGLFPIITPAIAVAQGFGKRRS